MTGKTVFDRAAAVYDRIGPAVFSYFGNLLVEAAGVGPGARVLDAAAGTGAVMGHAIQKLGNSGRAVGIDISRQMTLESRSRVKCPGRSNIHVIQMDAQRLSFADQVFDYVLCGFSVFFFPRPLAALEEFKRVLVNKGIVGITSRALDRHTQWLGQLLGRFAPGDVLAGTTGNTAKPAPRLHTAAGVENLLAGAGFSGIRVTEKQACFTYQDEAEWWAAQWANGLRLYLEAMTPNSLEQFKREAFKKLTAYKKKGSIHMPIRAIVAVGVKEPGNTII